MRTVWVETVTAFMGRQSSLSLTSSTCNIRYICMSWYTLVFLYVVTDFKCVILVKLRQTECTVLQSEVSPASKVSTCSEVFSAAVIAVTS